MKLRMVPLVVMLVLSLLPVACTPSTSDGTLVVVPCDAFDSQPHRSKQIEIAAGDSVALTICSNATAGFQWTESAQISAPSVVQQMEHAYLPPATKAAAGTPGNEVWVFKALRKGISTIYLEYGRPWEGGENVEWTFTLILTVK